MGLPRKDAGAFPLLSILSSATVTGIVGRKLGSFIMLVERKEHRPGHRLIRVQVEELLPACRETSGGSYHFCDDQLTPLEDGDCRSTWGAQLV